MKSDIQVRHVRHVGIDHKSSNSLTNTTLHLYPFAYILRPYLEYIISSWSQYREKDINELEKIAKNSDNTFVGAEKMWLCRQVEKNGSDQFLNNKIINNLENAIDLNVST